VPVIGFSFPKIQKTTSSSEAGSLEDPFTPHLIWFRIKSKYHLAASLYLLAARRSPKKYFMLRQ
jgi:hypothetical protein